MRLEIAAAGAVGGGAALIQDGARVVRVGVRVDEERESVGVVAEAAEVALHLVVGHQRVRPQHRLGFERRGDAVRALEQLRSSRHQSHLPLIKEGV